MVKKGDQSRLHHFPGGHTTSMILVLHESLLMFQIEYLIDGSRNQTLYFLVSNDCLAFPADEIDNKA